MSLGQRFERRLESLVGGAFARVFKGQVEPVEIGSALQREASDKRNVMGSGQVLAPNRYRVTLSPEDHERLVPWEVQLTTSLAELVQEHLDEKDWSTIGDIEVYLVRDDSLHTGVFGVASRMEPNAPPRTRPHDSMSLPMSLPLAPSSLGGRPGVGAPAGPYGAPAVPAYGANPYVQPAYSAGPGLAEAAPAYGRAGAPAAARPDALAPQRPYRTPGAAVVIDGTGHRHELRAGSNIIGRGAESDLQLLDQGVSRKHVNVEFDGSFATVYDLGSTNGTEVNGHPVGSQLLRHGDVIRIGHTKLVFQQEHM